MKNTINKVIVMPNGENNAVTLSNNPEYGYIRVESKTPVMTGRFVSIKSRSALIAGKTDVLQALYTVGQELPGKIVVKESTTPTNPNNIHQDVKLVPGTTVPCMIDHELIYRTAYYTENMTDTDVLIQHDNIEETKAASATTRQVKDAVL